MSGMQVKGEYILQTVTWREDREAQARGMKELIRCKDCKHWYCYGDETFCSELGIYDTNKESYCSYAKREEK